MLSFEAALHAMATTAAQQMSSVRVMGAVEQPPFHARRPPAFTRESPKSVRSAEHLGSRSMLGSNAAIRAIEQSPAHVRPHALGGRVASAGFPLVSQPRRRGAVLAVPLAMTT